MSTTSLDFTCRNDECEADLVVELTDCYGGCEARITADPFHSSPAEGPEWSWDAVTCEDCGTEHDVAWLVANLSDAARRAVTAPEEDDGPEFDPMDADDDAYERHYND